jgi:hypothetical protein
MKNENQSILKAFETLEKFINARPNLDPANYGCHPEQLAYSSQSQRIEARRSMHSELASIQKDGTRARKALKEARTYSPNAAVLAEAFGQAFSGRLSWDGSKLDYCTGQYFPTEYRAAAATVLEYYNHAMRPKFVPETGTIFTQVSEIIAASQRAGSHYFDKGTMGFFKSRVLPQVFHGRGGIFFVTSEKGPSEVRAYTIRKFYPTTADVHTFGEFNVLTRERALRLARIAAEYPEAAKESLDADKVRVGA